ncbi:hypothetical protein M407DRAFT_20974 [Tulasnella calospora MUT 4182]|uniref:Protein kinase domain-containing protein n=1 Tax=Tulasnella calospora MUT 4182 TaxID=1051891 RepID=A0A0C3QP11_9AGAM|nr:hypothetical protein M407DRAFT_20974 [Tulasnella calospora MUT 4182]
MSNPSPQSFEAGAQANDAGAQREAKSLEQRLEGISLNHPQPKTDRQEPNRIKLSACTLDDGNSLEPAKQVAVKKFVLNENIDEEKLLRTFANELCIVDGLDHSHIVRIFGFVEDTNSRIAWLVFPWEANDNIREFLLSGKWELPERVSLIKDVASGLEYLHGRQPPIRRGDLKSLNILVNANHRAVITDFGSARIQTEARRYDSTSVLRSRQAASTNSNPPRYDGCPEVTLSATNAELTLTGPSWSFRWAAPEILNDEEPCLASDIWALGWIAWEVVTDNYPPPPEAKTNQSITLKVIQGLLPSLHEDGQLSQIGRLCDVMVKCWKLSRRSDYLQPNAWKHFDESSRSDGISQVRPAALLVQLGDTHRLQSRYEEALKFFEEGFAVTQSPGDESQSAYALYLAGHCHRRLFSYDHAEKSSSQALAIYTSIGNSAGQAITFRGLGDIYLARSNYAKAKEYYNQALTVSTSIGARIVRANTLLGLGQISRAQSNSADAEDFYTQALAICISIKDRVGQANTLWRLRQIHQGKSDSARAEEIFKQALARFTSLGSSFGRANVWRGLGAIHLAQSDYSAAEESFNHALIISTSTGNSSIPAAIALQRLGKIHQARSNYAEAEGSYTQALAIYTTTGHILNRTNMLLALGEVLLRQSRYSEVKSLLDHAVQVANQIDYKWAHNPSKELIAEVVEAEKSSTESLP